MHYIKRMEKSHKKSIFLLNIAKVVNSLTSSLMVVLSLSQFPDTSSNNSWLVLNTAIAKTYATEI